jgi:hypothetical protein
MMHAHMAPLAEKLFDIQAALATHAMVPAKA